MNTIIYNVVFWIFISYFIRQITGDFLVKKMKVDWFENKNYINDKWTKRLGVLILGWAIKNTILGIFNKKLKLKIHSSKAQLEELYKEMGYAEVGHLIGFYFLVGVSIYFLYIGVSIAYVVFFTVLNIIFNLYLVFLQQYNKRRIRQVLDNYLTRRSNTL